MNKTKIEWAESTWNPVTGCNHDCPYCYARGIASRFGGAGMNIPHILNDPFRKNGKIQPYPFGFVPTFHRYKLNEYASKFGRNIFVCSMADLFGSWVPDDWIEEVFKACQEAPQHNYIFLTKNPGRYIELENEKRLPWAENFWFGTSITGPNEVYTWFSDKKFHWFLSVEPILSDLGEMDPEAPRPEWVIIGAETGRRKEKVVPERNWIENLVNQCRKYDIPVFMKGSLSEIWGKRLIQEFPEGLKNNFRHTEPEGE